MTIFSRLLDAVRYILRKADMVLLGLCLVASAFGIVLIASATNYRGVDFQLRRVIIQAAGAVLGIAAYFIFSNVDVEHFAEKWPLFLLFNLGFIALLLTPLGTGGTATAPGSAQAGCPPASSPRRWSSSASPSSSPSR